MKIYRVRFHSFVDLITNSSTEVYIHAGPKTVESIKSLIDNLLKLGGSELKSSDLFEISLDLKRLQDDYAERFEDDDEAPKTPEALLRRLQDDYESGFDLYILVKAKDDDSELAKTTAKVLSSLTSLFELDARSEY